MQLVVTELDATYIVTKPFRVPFHGGGMLHGLFGRAVRKVACAESAACSGACARDGQCDASRLFDPAPHDPPLHPLLAGQKAPPGPVVVVSPPPGASDLAEGEEWGLGLRLFGEGREKDVAILERALAGIAELPMGTEQGRVELNATTRFVPRAHTVLPGESWFGRLTVRFETPTRLKRDGKPIEASDLDFATLFSLAFRRLTMMSALYGQYSAEDDAMFKRLREAARFVRTAERRLRPMRWDHLSMETGERKPLRGLIGYLAFEGNLGPFLPVLRAAEVAHIGGGTSFGLGRLGIETSPAGQTAEHPGNTPKQMHG